MGITPSREKFIALEGYAQKSVEERNTILTNAGMEITQTDKDLAEFLGAEDVTLGCFIRGIITICIDEHNNIRNQEFTRYMEEYKNVNNEMLEQKHIEMNEQIRMMEENWKLKEEYYFKNSTMKKHQIVTELGSVDQEDKEKLDKYNKCKDMIEKDLEASDDSNEGQLWETNSDTTSDTSDFNQSMTRRYNIYNKSSHLSTNDTPHNTNRNSQMQETIKNGNSQYSRHQSITMAFTADHDMGANSRISKESMHKPKTADDLKYFAGLLTTQIRDAQTDQSIIEYINNNKLLEYHMNTLGRMMKNGNEYTYVGFFTETAKNNFLEDGRVKGTLGNFRDLEWLNKLYKTITISVTGIDEKMDINEVIEAVERKLGKMQKISQQGKQYGKINLKLVMEIRCTEEELMNTWGILLKNRMIKIEPINYKNHVIRQRGKISASVLDIPNEIDELEVAKILRQTGARYWYKSNNKNKRSYQMNVYFNNEEERKAAIGRKIKIKDQIFTWFFRAESGGRQQSNFRQQGSNFRQQGRFNGRYQGQNYNRSFDNRARCYICKKNNHNANKCYFNNDNNKNTNEHRSHRNENQNRPFRQESGRYNNDGKFNFESQYEDNNDNNRYNGPNYRGRNTNPRRRFNDNHIGEIERLEYRGYQQGKYYQQYYDHDNNGRNTGKHTGYNNNSSRSYDRDWNEGSRFNDRRRMARRY
ncbi:uncharacterized protein OCT59_024650 [Rhizophagus irregularis]|uniref:uncharacterized protein n=1 Tax=Rhizophagus irregularis TaxID=588596 RepID=UPI000CB6E89E|nr:hypothetical protein OCT59_024650 [Rhizophagus irregularis]GBC19332.1 hypothetical protein GLOIN_2v1824527 [Rhizophagus irregularis DAOM 181602=DAOM 197198]